MSENSLQLVISSYNSTFDLKLSPDNELIHSNSIVEINDNNTIHTLPLSGAVYQGHTFIQKRKVGWARVVFTSDKLFDGVFTTNDGIYTIKQVSTYQKAKRDHDTSLLSIYSRKPQYRQSTHILIRELHYNLAHSSSSISPSKRSLPSEPSCGSHFGDNDEAFGKYLNSLSDHRNHKIEKRQSSSGCPASPKILVMAAAADCTYVNDKGGAANALNAILSNFNSVNKVYQSTFNITLALVKVQIEQSCTPTDTSKVWNRECSNSYTISQRLSDFSKWRGTLSDDYGLWHLFTKCSTQPAVGIAWKSMLCSKNAFSQTNSDGTVSWVSGTALSAIVPLEWKVVAHEIGHNFGAVHDCTSQSCPCTGGSSTCNCCGCTPNCDCDGKYLMNPMDTSSTNQFSPCTISTICNAFPTLGNCLVDSTSLKTISSSICGNGVKEGNEQCDCGSDADCLKDPCCDGKTCLLKNGSQCDDLNDSCCSNCRLKANGTICRASTGKCDIQETCTGTSADCPNDSFFEDGTSCVTSAGISANCASGLCTSRDLQCVGQGLFVSSRACDDFYSECKLYCQENSGTCLQFNGRFVDGTPCGASGRCKDGSCQGTNWFQEAIFWYQKNLKISIPLTILASGLIILTLWMFFGYIYRKVKSYKTSNRNARNPSYTEPVSIPLQRMDQNQNQNARQVDQNQNRNSRQDNWVDQNQNQNRNSRQDNWVDHSLYNG